MLSSTAYLNSGSIGGDGGFGPRSRSDAASASTSAPIPAGSSAQDQYTSSEQEKSTFLPSLDTVKFSPAARQLAQQNNKEEQAQTVEQEQLGSMDATAPSETEGVEEKIPPSATIGANLNSQEQQKVQELKLRDQEVRIHEAAHAAVGGQHAGTPTLEYATGPDGKRYAVAGAVSIDLSKVAGDSQGTIAKMEQIQAAALAPAQPSTQDRRVAARAAQIATQARMELRTELSTVESSAAQDFMEPTATTSVENTKPQLAPPTSTPAVTIESLRWAGAVA
ncbi:MAG: putative metalloprotease CJM1_0395 family protein [Desulfuromonadaceae bacterium]|nr:putative metalloprotease CJM1_0395 family protein [Desulfuromonadaceae bacterium]